MSSFFFFFFLNLLWLMAAAVAVCSISASVQALSGYTSPVLPCPGVFLLMDYSACHSLSLVFFFFFSLFHRCFSPPLATVLFLINVTHLQPCLLSYVLCSCSLYFFIRLCVHKHSSFCLPVVYRALVSIKWASLLFQKDSLKCQRDQGGRFFLSPYLSWKGTTIIKITGLI